VIFSVLTFDLKPGARTEFENVFARHGILEKAIKVQGCMNLYIAYPDSEDNKAFVVGLWDDADAYQRWMDHPERGVGTEDLLAVVSGNFDPSAPAEHWTVFRNVGDSEYSSISK